jgi:MarR family transcriptional regulator, lower aerobic nicotinate degradation pathway regulator
MSQQANVLDTTSVPEGISPDTALSEFAGQLFFRLWRASHTRIAQALEPIDMTPALFGLLNLLGSIEGANQQELGTAMGVDPSTMVALIDELEAKGLAKRQPHPKDRRARSVVLTAKGRRLRERGRQMASQVDAEVLGGMDATDRQELLRLLRVAHSSAPPQPPWSAEEGD